MLKMKEIFAVFYLCNIAFGQSLSISEAKSTQLVTENNDTASTANNTLKLEEVTLRKEAENDSSLINNSVNPNDTLTTDNQNYTILPTKRYALNENITDDKILQEFDSKKDNKVDERSFLLIKSQKYRWPKVHHLHHNSEVADTLVQLKPYRNYMDAIASASSYFFRRPSKQKAPEHPKFSLYIDDPFKELTHHMNQGQKKTKIDKQRLDYNEANRYEMAYSANQYAPVAMPPNEHTRKYLNSRTNGHNQHHPTNCLKYAIYPPNMDNARTRPFYRDLPSKKREDLEVENTIEKNAPDNTDDIDLLNKYLNSAIESRELTDRDPTKFRLGNKEICDCRNSNADVDVGWIAKRDDKESQYYENQVVPTYQSRKCKNHFYDSKENEGYQEYQNDDITTIRNSNQTSFNINYT